MSTDCCIPEMTNDGPVDWVIDWTDWLTVGEVVDTISGSDWSITSTKEDPVELEISSLPDLPTFTDYTTKIWLTGGTDKITYLITNTITTAGGREQSRAFKVKVKDTIVLS